MLDYSINGLSVSEVAGINPALQPTVTKRVVFYVGARGPFYLTYSQADFTAETVIADVNKQVDALKSLDAGLGVS